MMMGRHTGTGIAQAGVPRAPETAGPRADPSTPPLSTSTTPSTHTLRSYRPVESAGDEMANTFIMWRIVATDVSGLQPGASWVISAAYGGKSIKSPPIDAGSAPG